MSAHMGGLIPEFGLGGRYQKRNIGFDLSLDGHTLYVVSALTVKGALLYFSPHSNFDWHTGHAAFNQFTLGKKTGRKSYIQFELPISYNLHGESAQIMLPRLT